MNDEITIIRNDNLLNLETWYTSIEAYQKKDLIFDFNNALFFTIHLNDIMIGMMSICEDDKRLDDLKRFVLTEHRNKGYAEMLLDHLIEYARNNNFISIRGSLKSESERGINFFEAKDFVSTSFGNIEGQSYTSVMLRLN